MSPGTSTVTFVKVHLHLSSDDLMFSLPAEDEEIRNRAGTPIAETAAEFANGLLSAARAKGSEALAKTRRLPGLRSIDQVAAEKGLEPTDGDDDIEPKGAIPCGNTRRPEDIPTRRPA